MESVTLEPPVTVPPMLAKPPKYSVPSLTVTPDYSTTIIMHSLAFEQEMTQRRMTHDRNKFHKLPACLLTDEEMAQYMKGSNRSFCQRLH